MKLQDSLQFFQAILLQAIGDFLWTIVNKQLESGAGKYALMTDPTLRVLLCHAPQDQIVAQQLLYRLKTENGLDAWVLEEKEPVSDELRKYRVNEWLDGTVVILACFSRSSLTTGNELPPEVGEYLDIVGRKYKQPWVLVPIRQEPVRVIPVRLDECPVPERLKNLKCFDLFAERYDRHYEDLLRTIQTEGRKTAIKQEAHNNREIRKIERIARIASAILNVHARVENRPILWRRKLRVHICFPHQDLEQVGRIHQQLKNVKGIAVQLGEELKGSSIERENRVKSIVRKTDLILLCLSARSTSQNGFYQEEFARIVDWAKRKPLEKLRILPVRLDDFVPASHHQTWQWLDYFTDEGPDRLLACLEDIARNFRVLRFMFEPERQTKSSPLREENHVEQASDISRPEERWLSYSMPDEGYRYWISRQPVTCLEYDRFLHSGDYGNTEFWQGFEKYDVQCRYLGTWDNQELSWIDNIKDGDRSKLDRYHWSSHAMQLARPHDFINRISWYEASAFCKWLAVHWHDLPGFENLPGFHERSTGCHFRLPLRTEWLHAVQTGNVLPAHRYPDGKKPADVVHLPFGRMEWFANLSYSSTSLLMEGYSGYLFVDEDLRDAARLGYHAASHPSDTMDSSSFRLVAIFPDSKM